MRRNHAAGFDVRADFRRAGFVRQPPLRRTSVQDVGHHERLSVRRLEINVGAARFQIDVAARLEINLQALHSKSPNKSKAGTSTRQEIRRVT